MQTSIHRAYDWLSKLVKPIKSFFQIRLVRVGLQVLTLFFCTFYLYINLKEYNQLPEDAHFSYLYFGVSWFATIIAVFCGAAAWWLILRSLFQPAGVWVSVQSHVRSNLAKYIPGFAWQIIGKAYLTRQFGVPTGLVGFSLMLEMATVIMVGAGLAVLFLPLDLLPQLFDLSLSFRFLWLAKVFMAGLVFLIIIFIPEILQTVDRRTEPLIKSPIHFRLAAVVLFVSWLIFGIGYWLLGNAFQSISAIFIPRFTFTLSVSVILGLIVIFAPGGIGIRESIMVYLLGPLIGGPLSVILAASSRVTILLSELVAYLFVETYLRLRRSR